MDMEAVEKVFWAKVDKTSTCWLWKGYTSNGYGTFPIGKTKRSAHRVAYEFKKGKIPEALPWITCARQRTA